MNSKPKKLNLPYLWINILFLTSIVGNYSQFFLSNVIFGANIFNNNYTIPNNVPLHSQQRIPRRKTHKKEKIHNTLLIMIIFTIIVNFLNFNISNNFHVLILLISIISTIRDINFKIKKEE